MKLLSFDVGIKNLAYCLIEYKNNTVNIIDWNIINLCKNNENKCNYCLKPAKFFKKDLYCCTTHARKEKFRINTSDLKINKLNINKLREKAEEFEISYNTPILKQNLLNLINEYIEKNFFENIKEDKAEDFNLITLGISLKNSLDSLFNQL